MFEGETNTLGFELVSVVYCATHEGKRVNVTSKET